MRDRYLIVVATIAASVLTACSDAAVEQITAPPSTVTPVQPVASFWPTREEVETSGTGALGIQITLNSYFSADTLSFVVEARIRFQWANDVSATVWASLLNKNGSVVNSSEASMAYVRLAVPVASGDTTLVVRTATMGVKCGLIGKNAYAGRAAVKAIDASIVVVTLWHQDIGKTNGPDVVLPSCPEPDACQPVSRVIGGTSAALPSTSGCDDGAPAAPNGGEPVEVCYVIWREFWIIDLSTYTRTLVAAYPIGYFCYTPEE